MACILKALDLIGIPNPTQEITNNITTIGLAGV